MPLARGESSRPTGSQGVRLILSLLLLLLAGCTPTLDYTDPLGRYEVTLPFGWKSPETVTNSHASFVHRNAWRPGTGPIFSIDAREVSGAPEIADVMADWIAFEGESGLTEIDVRSMEFWTCGPSSRGVRVHQVHKREGHAQTAYQAVCYVAGWRFHINAAAPTGDWGRFRNYYDKAIGSFQVRLAPLVEESL